MTELNWAFREQSILDYGIDATVEQRKENNPTGKFLSIQIKTGKSYVEPNANGDIDYYIKPVHLDYWLNYQMPVLMVLCDPDKKILYWKQVAKRNLIKTSEERYKLTILKSEILNSNSLQELEAIIDTYSPTNSFNEDIIGLSITEVCDYAKELLSHCKDSVSRITQALVRHQNDTTKWKNSLEQLLSKIESGYIKSEDEKNQKIREIGRIYRIALNVLTQRLVGNDKKLAIDTHLSALCFIDKIIENNINNKLIIVRLLHDEILQEQLSIKSVLVLLQEFSIVCKQCDSGWGTDFVKSMKNCSVALQDYIADLDFLYAVLTKQVNRLN